MNRIRTQDLVALALVLTLTVGCSDITGPPGSGAGRRLLDDDEFGTFAWLPSGNEILFGTHPHHPFIGYPPRLEVIAVPGGARRTIPTALPAGQEMLPHGFTVQGSNVYFQAVHSTSERRSLYRTPFSGPGTAQLILDSVPVAYAVSPDEGSVAWVAFDIPSGKSSLVVTDIASGVRRTYQLERDGFTAEWSPSGRSILVHRGFPSQASAPFHLVDLASGAVSLLPSHSPPPNFGFNDIRWEGEVPWIYANTHDGILVRHSIPAGVSDTLMTGLPPAAIVQWSAGFESVIVSTAQCARWTDGYLEPICVDWRNTIERIAVPSGERLNVFQFRGAEFVVAEPSPDGAWVAYNYRGDYRARNGLYVARLP